MSGDGRDQTRRIDVGQFIVAGAAIGTLVFVITGNALWIGMGAALGVLVGGIWGAMQSTAGDAEREDRDD